MIKINEDSLERLEGGLRNCKNVYEKNEEILHDFVKEYLSNIFNIYAFKSYSYLNENHYYIVFNLPKLFNEIQVGSLVIDDMRNYFLKLMENYKIDKKFIILDVENMKISNRIRVTLSERSYK